MVKLDFMVGIFGNIISVLSFASPIGIFWEIFKTKSSDKYEGVPYVSSLLSTSLWTFYGLLDPHDGFLIVTVNTIGMASQIIYISIYLYYATKPRKMKYMGFVILDIVFVGTVVVVALVAFHGDHARRAFVGVLCATFSTVMYASPLSVLKTVMKTKSVIYMPFLLSLSLFVNAGVWFVFAILVTDLYVLVPNAVGIVLGSLQLMVYAIYWNKTGTAVPKSSTEMIKDDDDDVHTHTPKLKKPKSTSKDLNSTHACMQQPLV